jgi:hypothetical protein
MKKDPAIILPFGSKAFLFLLADGRFLLIKKPKHCCLGSEIKIRIVIYSSPLSLIVPLGSVRAL